MNYKIDVSLSTNEVYTLTFDYTFDESVEDKTIRLQIGDLMVETQDRRVVFKTTSSATCIKSNVRLGNVQLYEGNFEDYDQHGEYMKESYLKGRTLVNLVTRNMYDSRTTTSVTREFTEDGFRKIAITGNGSKYLGADFWGKNNFVNTSLPEDWNTIYTIIVFVRKNTFPSDISLQFNMRHKNTDNPTNKLKGEHTIIIKGGETGVYKSTNKICYYNRTLPGRYWGCFATSWSDTDVAVADRTDLVGCVLEYAVMVVQGDYYDDDITIGHYFEGVGTVKSPIVISKKSPENLFHLKDYTYKKNGGEFYSKDGIIGFGGNFRGYTSIDAINGGEPKDNIYLPSGTYITRIKYRLKKPCENQGTIMGLDLIECNGDSRSVSIFLLKNQYGISSVDAYYTFNNPIVRINLRIWYGGNDDFIEILEIGICKNEYKMNELTLGNSYVDTPSDLELNCLYCYDRNASNPYSTNPSTYDILDLTTGTITRKILKLKLNDYIDRFNSCQAKIITIDDVEFMEISLNHYNTSANLFPQIEDISGFVSEDLSLSSLHSQGLYDGTWFIKPIEQSFSNVNYTKIFLFKSRFSDDEISNMTSTDGATMRTSVKAWLKSKNFTLYLKLQTPIEEKIAKPKALRCYQNGSIITDSQQLIPELVTTLPISNKFETTKLVSGKTYNVYFDGTATELNVGGETVIAYPASPYEFTCGSTKTLTITGTDIANVMAVEKEQKNEQHEINATSVHINRIITRNTYNYFDDYVRNASTDGGGASSIRDRNKVVITTTSSWGRNGYKRETPLPLGTYKFHCKVKVQNVGEKYRVTLHKNIDGAGDSNYGFYKEVTSTKLIENIDYVGYFQSGDSITFHGFAVDQVVEYYDISLIKLSDEDVTSSIPNINYEETISTPTEPIILRSYGGVQDTYDIATGTVTKRVAQSVDNFDLVTLPSPETHTVTFDNMPVIYENGTVEFYTEHGLYPIARFEVPTSNVYDVSNLKANKQYTIRNASQIFCNGQSVPVSDVMTFTASQLAKGEMVITIINNQDPMIVEGDYGSRDIPSFKGVRSVEALEVNVLGVENQFPTTISLPPHISLYALPDGTKDEVDIKTGILTHNIGKVTYDGSDVWNAYDTNFYYCGVNKLNGLQLITELNTNGLSFKSGNKLWDGELGYSYGAIFMVRCDGVSSKEEFIQWISNNPITFLYKLDTPTTEKLILNYNHSCDYGRILPTGAMDYYNVVTSEYSQNISSVLLDGADVWNEAVEKENTVRLLYVSPTDILMKASGGLYCDNDMFPNIQDDSDVEHCRVHDTDNNKLYIYIDKNRLMSPDLVGFQIWLQENQFTVYYETSKTIVSIKDYSELDPELARWEMMDSVKEGTVNYTSNSNDGITIYPNMTYIAPSINRFEIDNLEPNTEYTIYAENMAISPTINLGGTTHNFVSGNPYTSGDSNVVVFNASPDVSNMMIIKGDTSNEVVPYFTGISNVINPTITSTNDTDTSSVTLNVILRSTIDGIKDSYNVLTGEYIRRVSEDLQELSNPIITTLKQQTLLAYENGKILISSESGLLPTLTYSVPSTNTFRLPLIKTRTQYTLKYPSASGTITIGSLKYAINSDSMVFTTPLTINGDKSAIIFSDDNPQDVMLIEGNYSKREVPLFSGVKSVTNPKITVLNNTTGESVLYECTQNVDLRSLPNGVSDTLDIVNKKLTQVTGIRPFQNGDYELDNVWTDGNYTVYGLSSPIVSSVEFETPVGYANSTIYLTSDYMIPVLNYRALSSNNFPLDLLLPNTTYTLYADTLVSGSYTLGGTHNGVFTGTEVINLGDITNNLLTFNGDLGLSNVMLIKGNSINSTFPFFRGLKSVINYKLKVEGMNGELNELMIDDGVGLRACGDLVDSVDLMTCTLTRNLSELTLNGSENWIDITSSENVDENYCLFAITVAGVKSSSNVNLACDKFNHYYQSGILHDKEGIYTETNQIRLCVKKTTIGGDTVNNIKSWLQQNNTTVIYALQNSVTIPLENQWTTMPPTSYSNQTTITSEVVNSLKPVITITVATTTLEQIVSDLQTENLMTMMALTEMFEMSSVSNTNTATTLSLRSDRMIVITPMATIYAKLIKKGLKSIDDVPESLIEQVKYLLRY